MVKRPESDGPPDLTTLSGRTRHILDVRQLSQHGLESEARLSRGYVSRILNHERVRLSPELLRRIADTTGVNFEWYATGRGEMDAATPPPPGLSIKLPGGAFARSNAAVAARNLETALAYHGERWTPPVVAAARALANEHELAPAEWTGVLDEIDAALRKVKIPRA